MPDTNAPGTHAGDSSEATYEERLRAIEREKRGLIGDLQRERAERQSLEERLSQVETSLTSAGQESEEGTPNDEVVRLSQDPRGYIRQIVEEAVQPVYKSVGSVQLDRKIERAKRWVAKQEKIDADEIDGSDLEKELIRIGKENGFVGLDAEEGIKASYKILQQEKKDQAEREAERSRTIAGQTTESIRSAPRTGGSSFTREQIAAMSSAEFDSRYAEIKEAESKGLIK